MGGIVGIWWLILEKWAEMGKNRHKSGCFRPLVLELQILVPFGSSHAMSFRSIPFNSVRYRWLPRKHVEMVQKKVKSQQETEFQGKFGLDSDLGLGNSYVFAGVPFRSIPFDSVQRGDFSQFGHSCPVNPKKEKNLLSGPALSRNPENGRKFWLLAPFLQLSATPGRHRKFGAELKRIRPERLTQSQLDKGR